MYHQYFVLFMPAWYSIVWTYHSLSNYQQMDVWVISTFWLLWIIMLWKYRFLCRQTVSILLGIHLRSGITGSYGNPMFNLFRKCQNVSQSGCTTLQSHPIVYEGCNFSISSPTLSFLFFCYFILFVTVFFILAILVSIKCYLIMVTSP